MLNPYKELSKINPQREDGNRQIATSVLKRLIEARLSGPEYQIILFIIDKTWGWGKSCDMISLSQFSESTRLERRHLRRVLDSLEGQRIIVVQHNEKGGRGRSNLYLFNKHWDTWQISTNKTVPLNPPLETVTLNPPLNLNSASQPPFRNSDSQPPFSEKRGVGMAQKGDGPLVKKGDSQPPTKERKKYTKDNIYIKKGEGDNVLLTEEEIQKLSERFGPAGAEERINSLSLYKGSTGKKYASDYLTILNWERRNDGGRNEKTAGAKTPIRPNADQRGIKAPSRERYLSSLPKGRRTSGGDREI